MSSKVLKGLALVCIAALVSACMQLPSMETAVGDPAMLADGKTIIQHSTGASNQNNCLEGMALQIETWKLTPTSPNDQMEYVGGGTVSASGGCQYIFNAAGMIIGMKGVSLESNANINSTNTNVIDVDIAG